jgi:hypothetical protein
MSFDPTSLFLAMVISSVGFGLFVYGRKQARAPHLAVGIALMVCPLLTSLPRSLVGIAVVLLLALWWAIRLGW